MTIDDRDLELTFKRARDADHACIPEFETVLARPVSRPIARPGWTVAALAAAILVVGVGVRWLVIEPTSPQLDRVAGMLRTPTDVLLDLTTPPIGFTIPRIGIDDWYPLHTPKRDTKDTAEGGDHS